jgi:hypothetical protein
MDTNQLLLALQRYNGMKQERKEEAARQKQKSNNKEVK